MKEFIDKLIEELEGVKSIVNSPADIVWNNAVKMCIYKVNELAEEYINTSTEHTNFSTDTSNISKMENVGWIPCSERLPSERDWYLAVFQENDSDFILVPRVADYIGEHTPFTTEEGWLIIDLEDDMNSYYKKLKCLAWCELPAPYTEGE